VRQDETRSPWGEGDAHPPQSPTLKARIGAALLAFAFCVFAAGGLASGCLFVNTLSDVLSDRGAAVSLPVRVPGIQPARPSESPRPGQPTAKPGPPPATPAPGAQPAGAPSPVPTELPNWRGNERVTFLLLGLDMREDERDQPTRSDTLILVTIDPATKRAGMLSIPRDLWVPIPGHGSNKINTAHFFGEGEQKGTGPDLARRTIELNFGVRVNYWAIVDFRGFVELIDAVDGITIDVPLPIKDDEYPTEDYGINRIYVPAGLQHLDGREALRYARSRHADSDFGRGQRQQAVLFAARERVLQPSVVVKAPLMIGILQRSLRTNVPLQDILPLFSLARSVDTKNVTARAVDYTMVTDVNEDGSILVPERQKIGWVIEDVFGVASGSAPTPTQYTRPSSTPTVARPSATPRPTLAPTTRPSATPTRASTSASGTRVRVLNGTMREGLAATTASYLARQGYRITEVGMANRSDYAETVILVHTDSLRPALAIADALDVPSRAAKSAPPAEDGSDITIILGQDARQP
jgi:LCP family protein required for cell wall assembly